MGAFYISPADCVISKDVFRLFEKKEFVEPFHIKHKKIDLLYYKKQSISTINHINNSGYNLYIFGTCFYKDKNYAEGLHGILSDFQNNRFDPENLTGSYFLLFVVNDNYYFYSDPVSIQDMISFQI